MSKDTNTRKVSNDEDEYEEEFEDYDEDFEAESEPVPIVAAIKHVEPIRMQSSAKNNYSRTESGAKVVADQNSKRCFFFLSLTLPFPIFSYSFMFCCCYDMVE